MDHPAHLITDFLPIMNKIASLAVEHDFGAPLLKNGNDGLGACALRSALAPGDGAKCRGNPIELSIYLASDAFRPLHLRFCSAQLNRKKRGRPWDRAAFAFPGFKTGAQGGTHRLPAEHARSERSVARNGRAVAITRIRAQMPAKANTGNMGL